VRVLRQPTLDEVRQGRAPRGGLPRPARLREVEPVRRAEKAALAYTEAITWGLETDDAFWDRLHGHFSEPELVELGYFVATTMGQQRWLRTLNIEHHQVLAGTSASMAPGTETAESLARTKASPEYWAKQGGRGQQAD